MICSHIENENCIFIQLHAEQSYTNVELYKKYSLGLNNSLTNNISEHKSDEDCDERDLTNIEKGVFGRRLTKTTILNLKQYAASLKIVDKEIVIDFKQLISVQKNIFEAFHEILNNLLSKGFTIILKNIEGSLSEDLKMEVFAEKKISSNNNDYAYSNKKKSSISFKNITDKIIQDAIDTKILTEVGLLVESSIALNHSSSIYLNKYVNVKKLFDNEPFFKYCIYRLAMQMRLAADVEWAIKKDDTNADKITLFFQTLTGSHIASLLSDLLHIDICYVDHIGPINNLYNTCFGERIQKNKKYVVVSDAVCLGTEVKIAKSLIEYSGGIYLGNVSIFRTKILKNEHRRFMDYLTLFEINKESNKKHNIDFKIVADIA